MFATGNNNLNNKRKSDLNLKNHKHKSAPKVS